MAKKNIKKKSRSILEFIKSLTKWIHSDRRNTERLQTLIDYYDVDKHFIINRILSYCYNRPHIIWYFNKYMNNLFNYNKFDVIIYIQNLMYLMEDNVFTNNRDFMYLKAKENKDNNRQKVIYLLKDYFDQIYQFQLNDREANFYYKLFKSGIISENDIYNLNIHLNGDKSILKLEPIEVKPDNSKDNENEFEDYFEQMKYRQLSDEIQEFIKSIVERKPTRPECKKCKLYENKIVTLDTNRDTLGPVHFAFVALNPGSDEIIHGKPLIGKAGKFHRRFMYGLNGNIDWVLTNILMCYTPNQNSIGKTENEIMKYANLCNQNLIDILTNFPAYYYIPMGVPAMRIFGIKGSVIQNSGKIFDVGNAKVIPLPHPSAAMQYENSRISYAEGWKTIYNINNELKEETTNIVSKDEKKQVNTSISSEDTLFDIITLNNKVLYIFIDKYGNKKYNTIDPTMPIYINHSDWMDCKMTEYINNLECIHVNSYERTKIIGTARDSLTVIKQSSTDQIQ